MKTDIVKTALVAIALSLSVGSSRADEAQLQKAQQPKIADKVKTVEKVDKSIAQTDLVDINSASKEQLKKLPGIGETEADKIIAGRPYLSKAHLQTHSIVSPAIYQGLRQRVIAKQKQSADIKAKNK